MSEVEAGHRTISVVVNTLDRADSLAELLEALPQQTHPCFEVVVVHGPCRDHTEEVLDPWRSRLKVRACPEPNLSMSRNIGIAAASGEVVAFIDDDGIPEPTWLEELAAAYDDPEVGAVGGYVYNHTGHEFQTRHLLSDRLGNTELFHDRPPGDFCFPGSARYPTMLGCNSSFRRSALLEVGGFDEEYDYYLDETDVCLRVVDAGWVVLGLDGAPVHHRYLPSGIRTATKVVTDNRSVVKNKAYFALLNATATLALSDVLADCVAFAHGRRTEMVRQRQADAIDDDGFARGMETIESGLRAGLERGLEGRRQMLDPDLVAAEDGPLEPFPTVRAEGRLRLVLLSRTLPPWATGGVGRYFWDLARELASRGHEVRIVTTGEGHDTVDLVDGVWVHRIVKGAEHPPPAALPDVPDVLWHNAEAVGREVQRIQRERPVDMVLSTIWDVEHAAVHAWTSIPVICAFTTSFALVRSTQESTLGVSSGDADRIEELERWAIRCGHAFQVNGEHVARAVGTAAGSDLDPSGTRVVPLGAVDRTGFVDRSSRTGSEVELLFFGRLEPRKGIDLLLAALPEVLERVPGARVTLVGADHLSDGRGSTFRERFGEEHSDLVSSGRVRFEGESDDERLAALLEQADLAVLPSRFESFGLVYVEAMAAGLPVVSLRGSGAEEVVDDGTTGLLVDEDPDALAAAMIRLATDPAERAAMGRSGRARYEQQFTVAAMADRFLDLFRSVEVSRPGDPGWPVDGADLLTCSDGLPGVRLDRSEGRTVLAGPGRTTVVLTAVGGRAADVEVRPDRGEPVRRRVHPGEFCHVVLESGARSAELTSVGGGPSAAAAVIRVSGGAVRHDLGHGS